MGSKPKVMLDLGELRRTRANKLSPLSSSLDVEPEYWLSQKSGLVRILDALKAGIESFMPFYLAELASAEFI